MLDRTGQADSERQIRASACLHSFSANSPNSALLGRGMKNPTVNLRDLVILIADPSSYVRRITNGMLRGFGANKVLEVEQTMGLFQALTGQKIDILLCDTRLPPHGGLVLTRTIRRNADNENRTMPILLMSSDTRETTIKSARDAGANMVVAKPMSPKSLYDRLAGSLSIRAVSSTRQPISDRTDASRSKAIQAASAAAKATRVIEVAEEVGPALAQDDIDNLFSAARTGQSDGNERQIANAYVFYRRYPLRAEWRGARAAWRASKPSRAPKRHIDELKSEFVDWLDRELQELSARTLANLKRNSERYAVAGARSSQLRAAAGCRRHHGLSSSSHSLRTISAKFLTPFKAGAAYDKDMIDCHIDAFCAGQNGPVPPRASRAGAGNDQRPASRGRACKHRPSIVRDGPK